MSVLRTFAHDHFFSVVERHIDDIIDHYADGSDTYVFLEGPRWETRGHAAIATGWRAYVASDIIVTGVEWVGEPTDQIVGEMGWIAGTVEMRLSVRGTTKTVRWRGTFVLTRCSDGKWRIVHEHFSQPHPDPYGIGDWLP